MNPTRTCRLALTLLLCGITTSVLAQASDAAPTTPTPAGTNKPAAASGVIPTDRAVAQSRQQLIEAYRREFAFLESQRRALQQHSPR